MGGARCSNGECARQARPKKCGRPAWCATCSKEAEGKIRISGKKRGRWTWPCKNWNTFSGELLRCSGVGRDRKDKEFKMCTACFRTSGQTVLQAKRAASEAERRKQRKMDSDFRIPASVDMHVITVRPNFARRTFHHEKTTHVARNAILCGRQDDWVLIRVSNSTNKTSYEEMGKESSSSTTCSEDKNCGCCEKGHIVGLVKLGATTKVCKRRGNTPEWLNQTCCAANTHSFVTELKNIVQLDKPYPFLQGALVPVMASIPSTILPQTLLRDLVKSSLVVRKRIADKVLGNRPQSPGPDSYDFCGPPGFLRDEF